MSLRNLEFATKVNQRDLGDKIISLFFTLDNRIFRHKFHSSFLCKEIVGDSIFEAPFFQNSASVLLCFPSKDNGLDVYVSSNQSELRSYLLLTETIDYETDIYLFSDDLKWCIRYVDEFYPDGSRMTFLYAQEHLIR